METDTPKKSVWRIALKDVGRTVWDVGSAALVTALVVLLLRSTVMMIGVIPSTSMTPTLSVGDFVFCLRTDYWFDDPQRGDIVFFSREETGSKTYTKRVVGLPGETIEIKAGVTYINEEKLDEPYLAEAPSGESFGPYTVPDGQYFMLGDNRNASLDSRYWAETFVPRDHIFAKVRTVLLPMNRFRNVYE